MTQIVNRGTPHLSIQKTVTAELGCPNCQKAMVLDPAEVDIGHVIRCTRCKKATYYPFERPWYKRRKLLLGYVASVLVSFVVGLITNYVSDAIKEPAAPVSLPINSK